MAILYSEYYGNRYYSFTVTQSANSTSVNWTFTVAGDDSTSIANSPIDCKINGVSVYTEGAHSWSYNAFPTKAGTKSGTYNVGKYGSISISLSGRPYQSSAGDTVYGTITLVNAGTYTITYDANGGRASDGTTSWSNSVTYGNTYTIVTNKSGTNDWYTRPGYEFVGWSTVKNSTTGSSWASTTQSTVGSSYVTATNADGHTVYYWKGAWSGSWAQQNYVLYACWKPKTYTMTYNANGGKDSSGGTSWSESVTAGNTYQVVLNKSGTGQWYTRAGYEFVGWSESSGATVGTSWASTNQADVGNSYSTFANSEGNTVYYWKGTMNWGANRTLYAVWKPIQRTITYRANGGVDTKGGADYATSTTTFASAYEVFKNNYSDGTQWFVKPGYKFVGWAESSTSTSGSSWGSTVQSMVGSNYVTGKNSENETVYYWKGTCDWANNVTLYAIWKPIEYTITYDANGGSAAGGVVTWSNKATYDSSYEVVVNKTEAGGQWYTKEGYEFIGWSEDPTATSGTSWASNNLSDLGQVTSYNTFANSEGNTVYYWIGNWMGDWAMENKTLYAIWKPLHVIQQVPLPVNGEDRLYKGTSLSNNIITPDGASIVTASSTVSATNVGTYTVTYKLNNTTDYQWEDGSFTNKTATWSILPVPLDSMSKPSAKTYTGSAIVPTASVYAYVNGTKKTLTNNTNYTLSYENNINAGEATIIATGKGNYTGTVSNTFTINKAAGTIVLLQTTLTAYTTTSIDVANYVTNSIGELSYGFTTNTTKTPSTLSGSVVRLGEMESGEDSTSASVNIRVTDAGDENHSSKSVILNIKVVKYVADFSFKNDTNYVNQGSTLDIGAIAISTGGTCGAISYSFSPTTQRYLTLSTSGIATGQQYSGDNYVTITANLSSSTTVKAAKITRQVYVKDSIAPTPAISGGTTLKATSQTLTISASDNSFGSGVAKYYFGTDENGIPDIEWTGSATSVTVNESATYYLRVADAVDNIGTTSVDILSYTVNNLLEKSNGITDTYSSNNYSSRNSYTYIIKKNTSIVLSSVYTNPSTTYCEFKGYSKVFTTTATTVSTANPTITANTTYYMWFNRDSLSLPQVTNTEFNYDGNSHAPTIVDPTCKHGVTTHYSRTGTTSAIEVGDYEISWTLKSTTYQKWNDNTTTSKKFSWAIVSVAGSIYIKVNNNWVNGEVFVKQNGVWKSCKIYQKVSGTWKTN